MSSLSAGPLVVPTWLRGQMPIELIGPVHAPDQERPGLPDRLLKAFPRHGVRNFGKYKREKLFQAGRRSRACAYLADDDHGPLALQEILLAGCPVVGVPTGASFIQDGVTGVLVDRLPPGANCVKNNADGMALSAFVEWVQRIQQTDRHSVLAAASEVFGTSHIGCQIIEALATARSRGQPLVG